MERRGGRPPACLGAAALGAIAGGAGGVCPDLLIEGLLRKVGYSCIRVLKVGQ